MSKSALSINQVDIGAPPHLATTSSTVPILVYGTEHTKAKGLGIT